MPKRLQWDDYVKVAESHGGICVHPHLPRRQEKVRWKCAKGHVFAVRVDNVKSGTWCPECAPKKRWTMERVDKEMQGRDIQCISDRSVAVTIQSRLKWQCPFGHEWEATIANVWHRKSGCPCCLYKSESLCREVFEEFFNARFPKIRTVWTQGLELDGYSSERSVAFEYQGAHHFKTVKHFDVDERKLKLIQERDRQKVLICRSNFISLYQIKHHPHDCNRKDDFQAYVESELVSQIMKEREELEAGSHWLQKSFPRRAQR